MGSTSKKIVEKNALELAKGFLMGAKSRFTPYRDPSIDPNTLRTLGPDNLNGTLPLRSFAAHFRHDPVKDLLVTLSLRAEVPSFGVPGGRGKPSSLMLNEYNREWNLVQSQVHHIPGLNYAHDFILTPSYYILHMSPFVKISSYLFFKIALGHTSPGEAMRHHKQV
ncbi:hypothetical protein HK102_011388 [Quaeritorhiza haematococci]|nr:hypothetical protein HK102_011388 [Quaeritorhiza haematococci]